MTTAAEIVNGLRQFDAQRQEQLNLHGRHYRFVQNTEMLNTILKVTAVVGVLIFAIAPSMLTFCVGGLFCLAARDMAVAANNLTLMLRDSVADEGKLQELFADENRLAQQAAVNTFFAEPFIPLIIPN